MLRDGTVESPGILISLSRPGPLLDSSPGNKIGWFRVIGLQKNKTCIGCVLVRDRLPLKDKVSLLENNIESYLQKTVVKTMILIIRLKDVSLSGWSSTSILC